MPLKRGDIILVPFPFTDLSSLKVRPAVIISADPQGEDIIIAFISSVIPKNLNKAEFLLSVDNRDFKTSGLKKDSVFKMDKLLTVHNTIVLRRLGHLCAATSKELDNLLRKAIGL